MMQVSGRKMQVLQGFHAELMNRSVWSTCIGLVENGLNRPLYDEINRIMSGSISHSVNNLFS